MRHAKTHRPIAQLLHVSKILDGANRQTAVLDDVSFAAYPGELVLLLGPSGSGKSTFLTILAGLQPPSSGEVRLLGHEVRAYSLADLQNLRAEHVGFVFQTFHLIDALNALDNILLVMQFSRGKTRDPRMRARLLLDQCGVGYLEKAYPRTMSQGEKQRVAVARALANNPKLIIADEPTGSLSTEQGMQIVHLLKQEAVRHERCVIIASHDQRIAAYADRVFYIQDGAVSEQTNHPA